MRVVHPFLFLPLFLISLSLLISVSLLFSYYMISSANKFYIYQITWAYDQRGLPVAILDVAVEGHVELRGVYLQCEHKVVLPKPGWIRGDWGKEKGVIDPHDPLYPGVVHVEYPYTIAVGELVKLYMGMGKVETHVLKTQGVVIRSSNYLVLLKGKYIIALELAKLSYGAWCDGKVLLLHGPFKFRVRLD